MHDNFIFEHIKSVCLADPSEVLHFNSHPTTISCHEFNLAWADDNDLWSRQVVEDAPADSEAEIFCYVVVVLLLICVLAAAGNLFIVGAATCSLRSVKISNRLMALLSLTANEAWSALLIGAGLFVNCGYSPWGTYGSLALEAFILGSFSSQSLHLIAVTILNDSDVASSKSGLMKRNLTLALLGIIWLLPSASFLAVFYAIPGHDFSLTVCFTNYAWSQLTFRLTAVLAILLPAILAVFANARSIIKRRSVLEPGGELEHKRHIRTSLSLACVFVVAWMPAAVVYVIASEGFPLDLARSQTPREEFATMLTAGVIHGLTIIKGLVNAILLICRVNEVTSALRRMLVCVHKKGRRQPSAVQAPMSKAELSLLEAEPSNQNHY